MSNINTLNKVNYVGLLYEFCVKKRLQPIYSFDKSGPDHLPEFSCTIVIHDLNITAVSKGATKMQSKHNASKAMFDLLTLEKSLSNTTLDQDIQGPIEIDLNVKSSISSNSENNSKIMIDASTETNNYKYFQPSDFIIYETFFLNIQKLNENNRLELISKCTHNDFIKDMCYQDESKVAEIEKRLNEMANLLNCQITCIKSDSTKLIQKVCSIIQLIPIQDNDRQMPVLTSWGSSYSFSHAKMCSMKMMFFQIEWLLCYMENTKKLYKYDRMNPNIFLM